MNKTVFDMVDILTRIEATKGSSLLSEQQKTDVLGEISRSLPAHQLCRTCVKTYAIIQDILKGPANGSTKNSTAESPKKTPDAPKKGAPARRKQLLHKADADGRGSGTSARVVNKKA